jgi:hypothetical protein
MPGLREASALGLSFSRSVTGAILSPRKAQRTDRVRAGEPRSSDPRSYSSGPFDDCRNRFDNHLHIEPQGPVIDVVQIKFHPFLK